MRSSIVLVLAVLALSAVLARSFITVPVALVEDAQGLVSNRRYFLDPANRLPAHYAALLNIGGENYRLLLVCTPFPHAEAQNRALFDSRPL